MKLTLVAILIFTSTIAAEAKPAPRKTKKPASRQTQIYRNPCPVSREQRLCGTVGRILRRCTPNSYDPNTGYYHDRCYAY